MVKEKFTPFTSYLTGTVSGPVGRSVVFLPKVKEDFSGGKMFVGGRLGVGGTDPYET